MNMKYYFLCSIVILTSIGFSFSESNAQNLIPNGNFEDHSKYKIDERIKDPNYPWTIHLLSHWKNNSWQVTYCNDSIGTTISKKDYNTINFFLLKRFPNDSHISFEVIPESLFPNRRTSIF